QAEDGIRDPLVTGVQTCALPIWIPTRFQICNYRLRAVSQMRESRKCWEKCRPGRSTCLGLEDRARSPNGLSGFVTRAREPARGRSEERRVGKARRRRLWASK